MKRQFSCLTMIVAVLLLATSGEVEGMQAVVNPLASGLGKVSAKGAGKAAFKSTATKVLALTKAGFTVSNDVLAAFGKVAANSSDEALEGLAKTMKSSLDDAVKTTGKSMDDVAKEMSDQLSKNLSKLDDLGMKATQFGGDDLVKIGKNSLDTSSIDNFNKVIDDLKLSSSFDSNMIKQNFKDSMAFSKNFTKRVKSIATDSASNIKNFGNVADIKTFTKELDEIDAVLAVGSKSTSAEKALARHQLDEIMKLTRTTPAWRLAKRVGGYAGMTALAGAGTIYVAILFMLPSLYHSAFTAQQHHNAMLQTYLPPIKFGNIVMQLPDSVVDMTNPLTSQFIYYGIPVNNPGEELSPAAKAAYPGVSGPTDKNKLSKKVHELFGKLASVGSSKSIKIPRYNLDAQALASLPIFVSYSDMSWSDWGSSGIPDPAFTQVMLDLKTAYVLGADGTAAGMAGPPLLGPKSTAGKTVQSFIETKLGQLKSTGSVSSYREFRDGFSSSKAGKVGSSLSDQFNCACLENNGGVLSADTVSTCSGSKASTCLLTSTLNQLAAGLSINADGTVMRADQDPAAEVAKGALGQVIPIQGLGDRFDDILRMFPGAEQQALANSGVLTISLGTNLATAKADIQGAPADNYVAKGMYVYQCKNTPLAKMLRSQAGGSASYNDLITDFIVFLDQDLNQVPMMAPVPDPANYNFMTMGLNPAIAYVSTILGNMDGNGGFSFLPQLNIQSPAALVAKGLPASFAPLYGLQAANGTLSINYNQNLSATIGSITQALQGHAKLGQQFKTMQNAMLQLLTSGPFGAYKLSPVDVTMQPVINGVNLMLYSGFNGYPVSQDAIHNDCSDLLIPLSAAGKTVTLPSSNVAQYYGLVTDLTYSVRPDGTIAVDPAGFKNSPISASWEINQAKASQFYWIDKLTAMGKGSNPDFAMPEALVDFVTEARAAWINWISTMSVSNLSKKEFSGIAVPGSSAVLTIASQQALENGLYVYTCSPNPSSVSHDYFVLTNSSSPQASDAKLGTMSATAANAQTNMLSIVSGSLYTMAGVPIKNGANVAVKELLQGLQSRNSKAFGDDLKAELNISVGQVASQAQALQYPFLFGGLQLGIYQADVDAGVYLYVDAAGAGSSANFAPQDYFVTVDSDKSPSKIGMQLSPATGFMVSLVSGNVYGPNDMQATMSADQVAGLIKSVSGQWRSGIAQKITGLTTSLAATKQVQQQQTAAMDAVPVPGSNLVMVDQSVIAGMIKNIAATDYLPAPFNMIKKDAASGQYVIVSPANEEGNQFIYTFFDIAAQGSLDDNGAPIHVGGVYDDQANLVFVLKGVELTSMLQQYGISMDNTGRQSLGVQNLSPIMKLDPADLTLRPGVSGKSMIYSNDAQFPSRNIVSPIVYQGSKFYIYYNLMMQTYYAMEVNGSTNRYIDMAGGYVYNLDGSPFVQISPVAMNNDDVTDLLLPHANQNNFIGFVMKNKNNNNAYSDFLNMEFNFEQSSDPATGNPCGLNTLVSVDEDSSSLKMAQMPFDDALASMPDISVTNQYNIYADDSGDAITYMVNSGYAWQDLQLVPLNMTSRALLNPVPAQMYGNARLIMKNNAPFACVFAGQLYNNVKQNNANSFEMTSGSNKIIGTSKVDAKNNIKYMEIVAGNVTYAYQFTYLKLSDSQLSDYRNSAWKVEIIADITGKVVLAKYLTIDGSGDLQLSPISMQAVINPPTNASEKAELQSNLGSIMQDKATGRFVTAVDDSTYPYMTQPGFVDLESGALFDSAGMLVGYTLQITDMMPLLQQLKVSVVRKSNSNEIGLRYRAPIVDVAMAVQAPVADKVEQRRPVAKPAPVPVSTVKRGPVGIVNRSRSTLLGRLSSKIKRKHKRK